MNSEKHVINLHNGEKKNIDIYFADKNDFENMYVVKYREIKVNNESDQLEKNEKYNYDPTNDVRYQYLKKLI